MGNFKVYWSKIVMKNEFHDSRFDKHVGVFA